jgi:hypothetical protein
VDEFSSLRIVSLGCLSRNEYIHSGPAIFCVQLDL